MMRSNKRQMTEGIELPNKKKSRTLREKEAYKYLRIVEMKEMKEKKKKKRLYQENKNTY